MSLDIQPALDAIESHLGTLGVFDQINMHEPLIVPGSGVTASVWANRIRPIAQASGLAATSAAVDLTIRIQMSTQTEPQDAIDPAILTAACAVINGFTADFDLSSTVSLVDLLGAYGVPLAAEAGFMQQSDNILFRVMIVTVPLIFFDVWAQVN